MNLQKQPIDNRRTRRRYAAELGDKPDPTLVGRLAYSVDEAAAALGIGRSSIWKLIAEGKVFCTRIGRRTLITTDELQRLLTTGI